MNATTAAEPNAFEDAAGPLVSSDAVTFRVLDPDDRLSRVTLLQELQRPRHGPEFVRCDGRWELRFRRGRVDRMEYLLQCIDRDGGERLVPDPANPHRVEGPLGELSVVEWPGYRAPSWLGGLPGDAGIVVEDGVYCSAAGVDLPVQLWTSPGASPDEPLPLLVAHDGPEYADYSGFLALLDAMSSSGRLPPMRAALIAPVDRDELYSASAAYARSLAHDMLPWLARRAPTPGGRAMRVGMGASLGALAMLHVHRLHPATFGALFLQSGSFFRQRYDKHESSFVRFRRISRFVGRVLTSEEWPHPIPVAMTCGEAEENLANNRAVRDALARQGYEVTLGMVRDAHNWTAWRDSFDPHLVDHLRTAWANDGLDNRGTA